ncbi:MAG: diaminopimelate decarboxylase [Thermotogae bacterium]|nr:diaminopimelate decarboxylase [Thermotogota bacterium]
MKSLPFTYEDIIKTGEETPFYIYDYSEIKERSEKLKNAFDWVEFKEFFAVKALPNPYVMKILYDMGFGMDCSSMAELALSERIGCTGDNIMFTSNDTPYEEYKKAKDLGAIINIDDISHLGEIISGELLTEKMCFRYNPGNIAGNSIIGSSAESKFGSSAGDIIKGIKILSGKKNIKSGLHAMLVSNCLNENEILENVRIIFEFALKIHKETEINPDFINIGGGFGIPYRPEEKELDLYSLSYGIKKLYEKYFLKNNLNPKLYTENGRYITGPAGYLITKVIHIKDSYKKYAGVDASMANLMRPGMYGAYHHISVFGKSEFKCEYDVVGSLCENNDKFAVNRLLPELEKGDIIVIHDAGAHSHSMGFNYNGKLRCAEFIYKDNNFIKIRRKETLEDLFSTLEV